MRAIKGRVTAILVGVAAATAALCGTVASAASSGGSLEDACAKEAATRLKVGRNLVTTLPGEAYQGQTIVTGQTPPSGDNVTSFQCRFDKKGKLAKFRAYPPAGGGPAPAEAAHGAIMDQSVPKAARNACLKAVAKVTNNTQVAITAMIFSQANSEVTVGVGPQKAPWRCLVSNSGVVQETMSLADEGAL
ncbi:hypothetical protein OSH08_06685 [Kaistia geumhonensis]|uniref:Uncharacterized protein n=1 Tax=Kaistia geumhonensis TaxID=410839 RepID=A0ABU0M557_9HYPH|nr:hypothetical protein [Kaistia geumhonensis]MCX5478683.1 hypothetical protein [Kaistia geumhonensis]MDQ0516099.1 hypothetical protein [Kaistia geumhonensis]